MYTQCPACRTIFEIDEDALQTSLGIVRCGHCEQRFDALATLSDSLPTGPDAALPEQTPEARTPTLTEAVSSDMLQAASKPRRKRKPAAETALPESVPDAPSATPVPPAEPPSHWFTPSLDERTRALIADAAGIPHEAIDTDTDWRVIDVPESQGTGELDIIPMALDNAAPVRVDEPPTIPEVDASLPSDIITVVEPDAPTTDAPQLALTGIQHPVVTRGTISEPPNHAGVITVVEPDLPPAARLPAESEPEPAALPDVTVDPIEAQAASEDPLTAVDANAHEVATATDAPVYVPPRQRRIHPHDWLWALGCLLLTVILAAQLAWANRVNLLRDPATQPTVLNVCARIRCDMPPIRDVAKLELLSRDIRPDPKVSGALLITATVRNNARFAQPWPIVVVRLTDLDNAPVAMRRFRPIDYLPNATSRAAGLAPDTTAAVAFEVADPGPRAVAFHFSFD